MKILQWFLSGLAGVATAAFGLRQASFTASGNAFGYRPEHAKRGNRYCTYSVYAKKSGW